MIIDCGALSLERDKEGQGDVEKPGKTHLREEQAEVFREDGGSSKAQ